MEDMHIRRLFHLMYFGIVHGSWLSFCASLDSISMKTMWNWVYFHHFLVPSLSTFMDLCWGFCWLAFSFDMGSSYQESSIMACIEFLGDFHFPFTWCTFPLGMKIKSIYFPLSLITSTIFFKVINHNEK